MAEQFIIVTAGIVRDGEKLLICRRPQGKRQAGYYEFPGGKLEPGEDPREGLVRELKEELGVEVEVSIPYEIMSYKYDFGTVLLLFFETRVVSGQPQALHHDKIAWVKRDELDQFRFLEADQGLLEKLKREQ